MVGLIDFALHNLTGDFNGHTANLVFQVVDGLLLLLLDIGFGLLADLGRLGLGLPHQLLAAGGSGFLGAGKTTLIKKLISGAMKGEKVILLENEYGEVGVDGGFMKEAGIEVTEMNSGCICCSLVGDFGVALKKVIDQYHPDRILIEPSGVGKLSDVTRAVEGVAETLPVE